MTLNGSLSALNGGIGWVMLSDLLGRTDLSAGFRMARKKVLASDLPLPQS